MGITEDVKRARTGEEGTDPSADPGDDGAASPAGSSASGVDEESGPGTAPEDHVGIDANAAEAAEHEEPRGVASPTQLGAKRFVYAAYFAGAIAIAFLMSKVLDFAWYKLQTLKPALGEPRDEIIMPASALIGALAAIYYWYRTRARQLAEEVAAEMAKVTWPTRTEVTNGTFVVIVTTVVSTVFFALMDKLWGFVTNLVYGGS